MIIYFSGTGNSRYCAQLLSQRLNDDCMDAFSFIRNGIASEFTSQRPWVFVTPTYAWQIPRVFQAFLQSGTFFGSNDAYFVMTCGEDIGSAAARNRSICAEKGLHYRGTAAVVMPENYIAIFRVPEPAEAQAIRAAALPGLEDIARRIRDGQTLTPPKPKALDSLKSGLVNHLFYRFIVKDKRFTVSSTCISCGKCQASCSLDNIRMHDGRPVWQGRCTHCMACICGCPTKAIEYGRVSRGKPRYQCPQYQD